MRIYNMICYDIESGEIISQDSYEYDGWVALCRGETEKAWNRAQTEKSNVGLQAGIGYGQAAGQERGYLLPQFQALANKPMSAEERAARLGGVGSAYESLGEKAGERMARTRNTAGYGELLDELARGKARAESETAGQLGGEEFKRRMAALGGIGSIYGTDVAAQTRLLTPQGPMKEPNFWGDLLNSLIAAGGAVGAAQVGKD